MFKMPSLAFTARALCVCGVLMGVSRMQAQTAITNWSISISDASNSEEDGIDYRNTTYAITQFSTASTTYGLGPTATAAYVRRNFDSSGNGVNNQSGIDNSNRSSTWYMQHNGDVDTLVGTEQSNMSGVLLNNNAIMGADNVFKNAKDPNEKSAGNIERIDFYFGATTVNASEGITIFDRGLAGEHDSVKIAVFTSWSGNFGAPLTYGGNVVTLSSASYGSNLDWNPNSSGIQSDMTYTLLRFNNGDNLTALDEGIETNTQGVAGSFISFANLGIATGTTIYGYSIMGSDTTTNVANLADWRNAAYYPTGTNDDNGGIDLMSFNGRIARPVPEPSTYGALLLGSGVLLWWVRRMRERRLTA